MIAELKFFVDSNCTVRFGFELGINNDLQNGYSLFIVSSSHKISRVVVSY